MDVTRVINQPVIVERAVQSQTIVERSSPVSIVDQGNAVDIVATRTRTVEIDTPGLPGPPGPPGLSAGGLAPPINFSYGDAPSAVWAPSVPGLLNYARLSIDTVFDGVGPTIKVGTFAAPQSVLPAAYNDPTQIGDYENTPDVPLAAGQPVYLAITPGSAATQGSGFLLIQFTPD